MILSKVEHIEHVRALTMGQRLLYTLCLSLVITAAFIVANALAILIAVLLFTIIDGIAPTLEETLVLSVPILAAFIAAITFTSTPPFIGQPVRQTAIKAARVGLKNGFITGLIFGVLWSFGLGLSAVRYERWELLFRREVIIYGLALGATISPSFALYRGLTSVIETVILNFVTGRRNAAA
jgi:hypothetical protein